MTTRRLSAHQLEALMSAKPVWSDGYHNGREHVGVGYRHVARAGMTTLRALARAGLVTAPERMGASGDAQAIGRATLTRAGLDVARNLWADEVARRTPLTRVAVEDFLSMATES